MMDSNIISQKSSEYDKVIQQLQTADTPMTPRGRATQQSPDTRKMNLAKQPALSQDLLAAHFLQSGRFQP